MNNLCHTRSSGFIRRAKGLGFSAIFFLVLGLASAFGEVAQEAKVTRIVNDVKLLGGNAAARPATLSEAVRPGSGVRTGADSRAELTFKDLSITRLGANTVFSFNSAGRTVDLGGGAVLVEAPPNSAAIHVNTAAFSAAVSGGTGLVEFHTGGISKIMILEGQGNITPKNDPNNGFVIPAGEMATLGPDGKWTTGQKFNVALIMKSSHLITDFGSLPNEQLIFDVIEQQKNDFGNAPSGNPPAHDTTFDSTVDRTDATPPQGGGGSSPPPTPGNIPVITSPNPYVITSGTTIVTDPSITTNGQTDMGAIYRGAALDGPLSAFLFDSTSAFDTASGFDMQVAGEEGGVGFKFSNLQISGNPTVDTTGGPDSIGLIAVGDITSGGPGGNVTFANARGVLLAAQNGSVNLGSELSFSGMHDLTIYARGTEGDLTLGSNVTTEKHLNLFAQRDMSLSSTMQTEQFYAVAGNNMTINGTDTIQAPNIEIFSFGGLTWTGETSDATPSESDGNVTIIANNNINVSGDFSFTRHNPGSLDQGLNLTLAGGEDVTVGGNLVFTVDNTGGTLGTGGNISVSALGNLSVNGADGLALTVLNDQNGQIGSGGNISLNVSGTTNTSALRAAIYTRQGGTIDSDAVLSATLGGALTTVSGATFNISTIALPFDAFSGGTISGNALISVNGTSVSSTDPAAVLAFEISTARGGHIGGDAGIAALFTGNVAMSGSGVFCDIHQYGNNSAEQPGGQIEGNATIDFTAANVSISPAAAADGAAADFHIWNSFFGQPTGSIGGDASINVNVTTLLAGTSAGSINLEIANDNATIGGNASVGLQASGAVGSSNTPGVTFLISNDDFGFIGGSATVDVQAGSLSSGAGLTAKISNVTGTVDGDANISVTVTGANGINLSGEADFQIVNSGFTTAIQPNEPPPFGIYGNASVNLDIQSGGFKNDSGLSALIDNSGSIIVGDASVTVDAAGSIQTTNSDAFTNFQILNSSGFIVGSANVNVDAASISTNSFLAEVQNPEGTINGAASVDVNVTGALNAPGGITVQVNNEGGSSGSNSGTKLSVGSATTASTLFVDFDNSQSGFVSVGGNSVFNATGNVHSDNVFAVDVYNYNGGTINTGGNVTSHIHGDLTTAAHSVNWVVYNGSDPFSNPELLGGTIGTGGNVSVTFDGNVQTNGTTTFGAFSTDVFNGGGSIGTGGNITVTGTGNLSCGNVVLAQIANVGGTITDGANITFHVNGDIVSAGRAVFEILNMGGTIGNNPVVDVSAHSFSTTQIFLADIDNEGGQIGIEGAESGVLTIHSDTTISVGGGMFVLGAVTAGGNVTAKQIASTDITTPGTIAAGTGGIRRFRFVNGNNTAPDILHTLTAASITSQNGINMNGTDADGDASPATNAASLTLNANSMTFGTDIVGNTTLNGGAASSTYGPGDGGTLTVNTSGAITVNSVIEATTGSQDADAAPAGNGGTVNLKSTGGPVTVNNRIEVSSNDPTPEDSPPPPIRRSDRGGDILVQSNTTTGTGITITANGALLSLLNAAATGPGGTITLSTKGSDIVVLGRVQADRGAIVMDQTDPPAATPLITVDGAQLISDSLTIEGAGDVTIGATNSTGLTFSTASIHALHDVVLNVENTSLPEAMDHLDLHGENAINLVGGNAETASSLSVNMSNPSNFTAGAGGINGEFTDVGYSGGELNLNSEGDITLHSLSFTDFYARGQVHADGAITITNDLGEGIVSAGTSIFVGGNLFAGELFVGTTLTAGGSISSSYIQAGGDITAADTRVQNIDASGYALNVSGTISPDVFSTDPDFPEQGAKAPHVYNVDTMTAGNGIDFSGNQFGGIASYSSGGILTVNARTLDFNNSGGIAGANFNGADAGAFTPVGGDGGSFTANTSTGDLNVDSTISATTGYNLSDPMSPTAAEYHGAGGNVALASDTGAVNVSSTIEVSSNQPVPFSTVAPQPYRKSASGGNISIQSGKASGTAIQISNTAQLLALLDNAAPGPGGVITVKATGASSSVNVGGNLQADKGTIDIEQTGSDGSVVLGPGPVLVSAPTPSGASPSDLNMRADIIKVGALGTNGTLLVGNAMLTADTLISLYGGSAGSVEFYADCTLGGAAAKIIAASTVTIDNAVTVTITGGAANVYADTRHFDSASGGDGTGGSFSGSVTSHPYSEAPGFGNSGSVAQNSSNRGSSTNNRTTGPTSRTAPVGARTVVTDSQTIRVAPVAPRTFTAH